MNDENLGRFFLAAGVFFVFLAIALAWGAFTTPPSGFAP